MLVVTKTANHHFAKQYPPRRMGPGLRRDDTEFADPLFKQQSSSFRGVRGASPESILTMVVMDSGLAPRGAPRNDGVERSILAARSARAISISLSLCEQRAQGKPGADCARRSRALEHTGIPRAKHMGKDYRYSRDIPAFPTQWLYGLYVLSPVSGVCCHRCRSRTGGADRRHGRGARTTRLRRTLRTFRPASEPA